MEKTINIERLIKQIVLAIIYIICSICMIIFFIWFLTTLSRDNPKDFWWQMAVTVGFIAYTYAIYKVGKNLGIEEYIKKNKQE